MNETMVKHPKSVFSKIGIAFFTYILTVNILSIIAGVVCNAYFKSFANGPYYSWVVSAVVQYGIGLPIVYFILRNQPNYRYKGQKLGLKNMLGCFALISTCSYVGSRLSEWINNFLGSTLEKEIIEPLDEMLFDSPLWLSFLVVVLIGPVVEELIFRRFVIDKVRPYGEMLAVIFSGIVFGAFHGNFSQFFYAASSGMVFAYVYLRTMRLIYPAILHISFNFVFGFIPLVIQKYFPVTDEMLENSSTEIALPMLINLAFSLILITLTIIGFIYLLRKIKNIKFLANYYEIPKGERIRTVVFNPGMIAFSIICLAEFMLYILV